MNIADCGFVRMKVARSRKLTVSAVRFMLTTG